LESIPGLLKSSKIRALGFFELLSVLTVEGVSRNWHYFIEDRSVFFCIYYITASPQNRDLLHAKDYGGQTELMKNCNATASLTFRDHEQLNN
jgi:hypothetical protein